MNVRTVVAVAALIVVLALVNRAILEKEAHIENGREVFLELAPVDPRSLMQGDYMALRFEVANELRRSLPTLTRDRHWWRKVDAKDGWVILEIDDNGVGRFAGVSDTASEASDSQINMAFRVRSGTIKFATNAWFFQEGTAEVYEPARYGRFRINEAGEPLLVALLDENLNELSSNE